MIQAFCTSQSPAANQRHLSQSQWSQNFCVERRVQKRNWGSVQDSKKHGHEVGRSGQANHLKLSLDLQPSSLRGWVDSCASTRCSPWLEKCLAMQRERVWESGRVQNLTSALFALLRMYANGCFGRQRIFGWHQAGVWLHNNSKPRNSNRCTASLFLILLRCLLYLTFIRKISLIFVFVILICRLDTGILEAQLYGYAG